MIKTIARWFRNLGFKLDPPKEFKVKTQEELDEVLNSGLQMTSFSIRLEKPPPEVNPLNQPLKDFIIRSAESNAESAWLTVTLDGTEFPEFLNWVVIGGDSVKRALKIIKNFEGK